MYWRSSAGPNAQFNPTEIGLACFTEFQKASVVWPLKVLPDASVIVPEIIIGVLVPVSSANCNRAKIAAFAFSVSKIVSISSMSAPPSSSAMADSL